MMMGRKCPLFDSCNNQEESCLYQWIECEIFKKNKKDKEHLDRLKDKELICYAIGAIGKDLYDKINKVGEKLIFKGTDTLPFKPELDIRNAGKRFVVDIAIQCLDYLLDKGE